MSKFDELRTEAEVAIAQNWLYRLREEDAKAILELLAIQAKLVEALRKSQHDINWMLNNEAFLNGHVFNYIDVALAAAEAQP